MLEGKVSLGEQMGMYGLQCAAIVGKLTTRNWLDLKDTIGK